MTIYSTIKIIVAVCVYNRIANIRRWIDCWKQSETGSASLVIIHNFYGDEDEKNKFQTLCESSGITYVPRNGKGFDIGAFQDVCRGRLEGFPRDWEFLLWCCDDTLPMTKDFITPFLQAFKPSVGMTCMKISQSVTPHVRTTGFMLPASVAARLTFPADPITTKQQCFFFEHRGGWRIMSNQVRAMGLTCQQVAPDETSPLWDQGYWKRLDRINEHYSIFGYMEQSEKIVFICPIFNMYPQIIASLVCQTYKDWELWLIHNGHCDSNLPEIVSCAGDSRVKYMEYPEATGHWGHKLRQWALEKLKDENAGYVCITNADNYYVPVFIEYMLRTLKQSHTAVAVYCTEMVHNYVAWKVMQTRFAKGFIDCGGVIIKKDIACEVGWRDTENHSADWVFFSDIAAKYSIRNFIQTRGCLFIHN